MQIVAWAMALVIGIMLLSVAWMGVRAGLAALGHPV